jgi:hypothetical protein
MEPAGGLLSPELEMIHPNRVVFELGNQNDNAAIRDLCNTYPKIRIVGVNLDAGSLTVFSGNESWNAPLEELETVILAEMK